MFETDCIYLNDPAIFQTIVTDVTLTSNLQNTWLASGCWRLYGVFLTVPTHSQSSLGNVEDQI